MKEYKSIKFPNFMKFLKYKFNTNNKKIIMTVLTWQDGDYFEEICNEDGGVIKEHLFFIKNKPLKKKLDNIENLLFELRKYEKLPYLHSVNGNYRIFYDIHLWINNCVMVYNIYLNQCYYKEGKNIFDKIKYGLFGVGINPKWINENQYELEIKGYENWLRKNHE